MRHYAAAGLAGLTVSLLLASSASAGMLDLGGGWQATWDSSLDQTVSLELLGVSDDAVHIRKLAEFTQAPPAEGFPFPAIPITFTQTSPNAVHNIVIDEEVITNSTGVDWTDFHMEILNGNEAFFDPTATANSGGPGPIGFDVSPFLLAAFGNNNHTLDMDDGTVADGAQWTPGTGASAGDLWLNIVTGNGDTTPFTVFSLKERPTATRIPGPATLGLVCLGLATTRRRRR